MTERERFATRGLFYRMIGDNQQCADEYGQPLAQYQADASRTTSAPSASPSCARCPTP